jgi:hypothetical protein
MKNDENSDDGFSHDRPTQLEYEEGNGKGMKRFTLLVSEWWLVGNVLTMNDESNAYTLDFVNGYYQFSDGYRPDNQSGGLYKGFALTSNVSRMWSDRTTDTHNWQFADTFSITGAIYIPCRNSDYGLLTWVNQSASFNSNLATHIKITLFNSAGVPSSVVVPGFTTTEDSFIHQPIYPVALNQARTRTGGFIRLSPPIRGEVTFTPKLIVSITPIYTGKAIVSSITFGSVGKTPGRVGITSTS